MPKYLFEADYSVEGTKGLIKDGGTKRKGTIEKIIVGLGGKVEAFYFTFGLRDAVLIADLPDNVTAAALSLAIGASGAVVLKTTPLITPAEMDQAAKKKTGYRPPGS
jgi:uncharacterized protein with GYD domain